MTLEVHGQAEVVAGFEELQRSLRDLTPVHRRVIEPLLPEVASRTPVRTGSLASSWSVSADATAGSIESGLVYAGPIEFGVAGRFEGAHMVLDTIHSSERAIVDEYGAAIVDQAAAIGFEVSR